MSQNITQPEKLPRCVQSADTPDQVTCAGTDTGITLSDESALETAPALPASAPLSIFSRDIEAALESAHPLIDLRPTNSGRPLAWRWALATRQSRRACRRWSDRDVRLAGQFVELLRRCRDDADRATLAATYPNIFHAMLLHLRHQPHARYRVQAYLLTRETHDQVAKRMAMHPESIRWFERLFFDFRPYLDRHGLMTHRVIETHLLVNRDIGALWKFVGYWYGAATLDLLMDSFDDRAQPRTPEQVKSWSDGEIEQRLRLRVLVYFLLVPVDENTSPKLAQLQCRMLRLRAKRSMDFGLGSGIAPNIRAMLEGLPWQPMASSSAQDGRG